jgi:hypothetical protein
LYLFGGEGVDENNQICQTNQVNKRTPDLGQQTTPFNLASGGRLCRDMSFNTAGPIPPGLEGVGFTSNNLLLYFFGGLGKRLATDNFTARFNELWEFDTARSKWEILFSSAIPDVLPIFPTAPVFDKQFITGIFPGAKEGCALAFNSDTNTFWVFGGNGQAANGFGI